jgi:hypothetical protein
VWNTLVIGTKVAALSPTIIYCLDGYLDKLAKAAVKDTSTLTQLVNANASSPAAL